MRGAPTQCTMTSPCIPGGFSLGASPWGLPYGAFRQRLGQAALPSALALPTAFPVRCRGSHGGGGVKAVLPGAQEEGQQGVRTGPHPPGTADTLLLPFTRERGREALRS